MVPVTTSSGYNCHDTEILNDSFRPANCVRLSLVVAVFQCLPLSLRKLHTVWSVCRAATDCHLKFPEVIIARTLIKQFNYIFRLQLRRRTSQGSSVRQCKNPGNYECSKEQHNSSNFLNRKGWLNTL